MANPQSNPPQPHPSEAESIYRCVCGQLIKMSFRQGAACSACGRNYNPAVFNEKNADETILVTQCNPLPRRPSVNAKESADSKESDPLINQRCGHFRIMEQLGSGGMGAVYLALDESLQRYVALKVIREGGLLPNDSKNLGGATKADHEARIQQLFQEARAQARVSHPNVVHIYFVNQARNFPFFAMELIRGPALKHRLAKGPLPFAEVVRIAAQLADALRHALQFDIVHGDVKPTNILQSESGAVKLSDFGLARRLSKLQPGKGQLIGTPDYLSPEAANQNLIDFRSDMYSLGVTLFELTFGRQPYSYDSNSVEERLQAHQSQPVQFPKEWPETVPSAWRAVLKRLLAKKPKNRYVSYDELLRAIDLVQPLKLPPAGLFQRGMAWLLDTAILAAAYSAFFAAAGRLFPTQNAWDDELLGLQFLQSLLSVSAALAVPIFAVLLYCKWDATPGKKLFQLRVVDPHGQPPSRPRFALRTVMQFLLVWNLSANAVFAAFYDIIPMLENSEGLQFMGIETLPQAVAMLLLALSVLLLLMEIGCALFSKKRLALHDRLFRTRVTLDTRHSSSAK